MYYERHIQFLTQIPQASYSPKHPSLPDSLAIPNKNTEIKIFKSTICEANC